MVGMIVSLTTRRYDPNLVLVSSHNFGALERQDETASSSTIVADLDRRYSRCCRYLNSKCSVRRNIGGFAALNSDSQTRLGSAADQINVSADVVGSPFRDLDRTPIIITNDLEFPRFVPVGR